jgi:hypothetical protein
MTHNPELAGQIRRNLYEISDYYDEALEPVRRASGSQVKVSKEPPLPISAAILDARMEAARDLAFWAWFILEEIRDINGDHMRSPWRLTMTPLTPEVLVKFIVVWVDRIVTEFPDDADNLAREVADHARDLKAIVDPQRREWVSVGYCPLTVAKDGESVECGTRLRAVPGKDFITCRGCGHEDTVGWWRSKIVGHRPVHVTAAQLVDILFIDARVAIEVETVRQWAHRGKITRVYGPRSQGQPWLYDWARVVAELTDRRKDRAS